MTRRFWWPDARFPTKASTSHSPARLALDLFLLLGCLENLIIFFFFKKGVSKAVDSAVGTKQTTQISTLVT